MYVQVLVSFCLALSMQQDDNLFNKDIREDLIGKSYVFPSSTLVKVEVQ